MKAIAKTKGNIELLDSITREFLPCGQPTVVTWTGFLEARTGKNQITVLANGLPDTASNAEFQEYLKEAESEALAVASFISQFQEKPVIVADREALEAQAKELGVEFRSNISDEKLAERIAAAEQKE